MNVDKEEAFSGLLEGTISALQAVLGELNALNGNGEADVTQTADADETGTAETPATEEDTPPWEEPPVTFNDIKTVLLDAQERGYRAAIKELLGKYGVLKLSDVDPADYPVFLKEAKGIGV